MLLLLIGTNAFDSEHAVSSSAMRNFIMGELDAWIRWAVGDGGEWRRETRVIWSFYPLYGQKRDISDRWSSRWQGEAMS